VLFRSGITWFAADALGELVHFEPPEVGSNVTKDQSYGETALTDSTSP